MNTEIAIKLVEALNRHKVYYHSRWLDSDYGWSLYDAGGGFQIDGPSGIGKALHGVYSMEKIMPIVHKYLKDDPIYSTICAEVLGQHE